MAELQRYTGSCHCGQVRFAVDAKLDVLTACNCSMCGRKGWLLVFVPKSHFTLLQGQEHLKDYQFNKHHIHHLFCSQCGVSSFSEGSDGKGNDMVSINVRCLEGVDPSGYPVRMFDGKSL